MQQRPQRRVLKDPEQLVTCPAEAFPAAFVQERKNVQQAFPVQLSYMH